MGRTMTHLRVAGAASVLVIAVLGGLLAYETLDDARAHRDATREAQQVRSLSGQVATLSGERDQLNAQLAALRTQNTALQAEARSPTLPMWNACAGPCAIGPNTVRVGSVPDTFQL